MTNFLREPATKKDVLFGASVIALLVVLAIFLAVRVIISLQERYDVVVQENRLVVQKSNHQADMLESQGNQLDAAEAQLAAMPTEPVPPRVIRRTVHETTPVAGPTRLVAVGGREARSLPSAPERTPRGPTQRPQRPSLPERPQRPSPPTRTPRPRPTPRPPAPAPPPATLPAPTPTPPPVVDRPIVVPPAVLPPEPPRPGNKPPGAPCPPRNPNCG